MSKSKVENIVGFYVFIDIQTKMSINIYLNFENYNLSFWYLKLMMSVYLRWYV